VVLVITLVILVILATLAYRLSARVSARRHRDQYLIDYSQARYACASALKYALASVQELEPQLISRPNEPDFSDLFAMSELEYEEFLAEYGLSYESPVPDANDRAEEEWADVNDANELDAMIADETVPPVPVVPGPYGPAWPLVTEPAEFEMGSTRVKIRIEDENAKYPLGWALLDDADLKPMADAGFLTFCEWMNCTDDEMQVLENDLSNIGQMKTFKMEFKPASGPVETPVSLRSRATSRTSSKTPVRRSPASKKVTVSDQIEQQNKVFATLFHSSLMDMDLLARRTIESDTRDESVLKYLGLWAARHVNVNTAPRHVLEAALAFGSVADAPKIAEVIILQRREKPFSDIDEVKKAAFQYSDSVDKCKDFLTTASTLFKIEVTATSGVATATAVAAVAKEGDAVKPIGVFSD
jgi:hypothetical protein